MQFFVLAAFRFDLAAELSFNLICFLLMIPKCARQRVVLTVSSCSLKPPIAVGRLVASSEVRIRRIFSSEAEDSLSYNVRIAWQTLSVRPWKFSTVSREIAVCIIAGLANLQIDSLYWSKLWIQGARQPASDALAEFNLNFSKQPFRLENVKTKLMDCKRRCF